VLGTTDDKNALAPGWVRSRTSRRSLGTGKAESVWKGTSFLVSLVSLRFGFAGRYGIADEVGTGEEAMNTGRGRGEVLGGAGIGLTTGSVFMRY
jgi:hypothetical protein